MTKSELLRHLEDAVQLEDTATTVYLGHISAIVGRSGLDESSVVKVREALDLLVQENQRHKSIVEELIDDLKREEDGDF